MYNNSGVLSLEADTNRDIQFGDGGTAAVMYIDNSEEKVGIGMTDPDEKLEVDGNIKISADRFYQMGGGSNKIGVDGGNAGMHFHTGDGTERMIISGSGNVGIGTSTPLQKLDTPNIAIGGSSIAASYRANVTLMDNLTGTARFYALGPNTSKGGNYQFNTLSSDATAGSGTVMFITGSTGNVGIGTSTPSQKLDVNGNIIADTYYVGNTSNYIDVATGLRLRSDSNGIRLMPNGTDVGYITHTGIDFIKPLSVTGTISASANITANGNIIATGSILGSSATFTDVVNMANNKGLTYANSSIRGEGNSLKLTATTDIQLQKATLITGGALSITGDGSNAVTLTESGNGDFTIDAPDDIRLDAGGGDIVFRDDGTEIGRLSNSSSDFKFASSVSNKDIVLAPNGSGKVLATAELSASQVSASGNIVASGTGSFSEGRFTGKLGVGINSPFLPLHVDGNARIDGNLLVGNCAPTNTPAADLHLKSSGTDAKIRIEDLDDDNLAYDFLVNSGSGLTITETTDATSRIHIAQGTGRVGIGTASPDELFDVAGTARFETGIAEGTIYVGNNIQHWGDGGTGVYFDTDEVQIQTNGGTTRATIDAAGLNIVGDITASGKIQIPSFIEHTGDDDTYFGFNGDNDFRVTAGGSDRFQVTGDVRVLGSTDFAIPATRKLYLDGQSNTYLSETSADTIKIFTGGSERLKISNTSTEVSHSLNVTGHVTASGNISASGEVVADVFRGHTQINFQFGSSTWDSMTVPANGRLDLAPGGTNDRAHLRLVSDYGSSPRSAIIEFQNEAQQTSYLFTDASQSLKIHTSDPGEDDSVGYIVGVPKVEYYSVTGSNLTTNRVVTLPNSLTYKLSTDGYEYLEVFTDGIRLNRTIDYAEVATNQVRYLMSVPSQSIITYKSLRTV